MHRILTLSGQDILATQHVKRWHMVRVRRVQTLAEHKSVVAMFAIKIAHLWDEDDPSYTLSPSEAVNIFDYALTHDSHEVEYGDPPSPAVDVHPEAHAAAEARFWGDRACGQWMPPVSEKTRLFVKIADKLEAHLFYLLEGEDARLKQRGDDKLKKLLDDVQAPLSVTLWISTLVESVRRGTFTPQPGGREAK